MRKEKECIRIALHANHRRAKQVLRTPLCTRITRRTASVSNFHLLRTRQCRQQSMCFLSFFSLSFALCIAPVSFIFGYMCMLMHVVCVYTCTCAWDTPCFFGRLLGGGIPLFSSLLSFSLPPSRWYYSTERENAYIKLNRTNKIKLAIWICNTTHTQKTQALIRNELNI